MTKVDWGDGTEPLDDVRTKFVTGVKEASGSFTVRMAGDLDAKELFAPLGSRRVYFYAPKDLGRIRHWFYVLMRRWRGWEYPTEVVWSGVVTEMTTDQDADSVTVTGKVQSPYFIEHVEHHVDHQPGCVYCERRAGEI